MKSKETIMTFVENNKQADPEFDPDAKVFSIPYQRIFAAEKFCKNEQLLSCFVGFKDHAWVMQASKLGLEPAVKVTPSGLAPEEFQRYIVMMNIPTDLSDS